MSKASGWICTSARQAPRPRSINWQLGSPPNGRVIYLDSAEFHLHLLAVVGVLTVCGGRVAGRQKSRVAEQFLAQGAGPVVVLVDAALLEDRHHQVDEVLEAL